MTALLSGLCPSMVVHGLVEVLGIEPRSVGF